MRCQEPKPAAGDLRRDVDRGGRQLSPGKEGNNHHNYLPAPPPPPVNSNHQGYGAPPARPPGYEWNGSYGTISGWSDSTAAAARPAWSAYGYAMPPRDYALEKPEAYNAFLRCVHRGSDGMLEVVLADQLCKDQHVADLLACVESWLMRELGVPSMSGQPWRLGRLDLARNGLSDESIAGILERMKHWGLRLRRLDLDSNRAAGRTGTALVDYVWNCQDEAIVEIGLADNMLTVDASQGADDPISALLRCLYNHPAYPLRTQTDAGNKTWPLVLRLAGNNIVGGQSLLVRIQDQGGASHIRFCSSSDGYVGASEEYLSVFLPDFDRQRTTQAPTTANAGVAPPMQSAQEADASQMPDAAQTHAPEAAQPPADEDESSDESEEPEPPVQASTQSAPKTAEVQGISPGAGSSPGAAQTDPYNDGHLMSEAKEETTATSDPALKPNPDEVDEESPSESESESYDEYEESEEEAREESVAESIAAAAVDAAFPVEPAASERRPEGSMAEAPALEMPPLPSTDLSDIPLETQLDILKDIDSDASRSSDGADGKAATAGTASADEGDGRAASGLETAGQVQRAGKVKVRKRKVRKFKMIGGKKIRVDGPSDKVTADGGAGKSIGSLREGDAAEGKITLVKEKFVMVDFGAEVEGMLYVTNLAKRGQIFDMFKLDDPISAEVFAVCRRRNRVSLRQRKEQVAVVLKSAAEVFQDKAGAPRPKRKAKADDGSKDGVVHISPNDGSATSSLLAIVGADLSDQEQLMLRRDIVSYLEESHELSNGKDDVNEDVAEFTVCALRTNMARKDVETEVAEFLHERAPSFVQWLAEHLKGPWLRERRSRAGATPKSAAARKKR